MSSSKVTLHHLRHATDILTYGGRRFLVDPMLADQGAYPGFPGSVRSELRNPLVPLPVDAVALAALLASVDAVLLTHLHSDHWDPEAAVLVPKATPMYAQNAADAEAVRSAGFSDVRVMANAPEGVALLDDAAVRLVKGPCQHGSDEVYAVPEMAEALGSVAGLVFAPADKAAAGGARTVYFVGDTIFTADVEVALLKHRPDVVVLNAGEATMLQFGNIICGKEDVLRVHELLPEATIVAVHLEAVNHCLLTRADLRAFAEEKGFSEKLLIPADGEIVEL